MLNVFFIKLYIFKSTLVICLQKVISLNLMIFQITVITNTVFKFSDVTHGQKSAPSTKMALYQKIYIFRKNCFVFYKLHDVGNFLIHSVGYLSTSLFEIKQNHINHFRKTVPCVTDFWHFLSICEYILRSKNFFL